MNAATGHPAPLRIAVVGTNFISDRFVDAASMLSDVSVSAVLSRAQETGESFASRHAVPRVFTDLAALLADEEIDALYIASPTICHADQTIAALCAGKHVLCEKMVADTYSAWRSMLDAATGSGRILLEAMRPAHDPALAVLRSLLPRLGRIRRVDLNYSQYSSRYDRFRAGIMTNAFDPHMHNSALADIGIYPLFLCVALFGEPRSLSATSVFLPNGFEGAGTLLLGYDTMSATVSYSKIADGILPSVIEGEEGSLTLDRINAPSAIVLTPRGGEAERISLPLCENNMIYEITDFVRMTHGEISARPFLDLSDAVMHTVDRAYTENGIPTYF